MSRLDTGTVEYQGKRVKVNKKCERCHHKPSDHVWVRGRKPTACTKCNCVMIRETITLQPV